MGISRMFMFFFFKFSQRKIRSRSMVFLFVLNLFLHGVSLNLLLKPKCGLIFYKIRVYQLIGFIDSYQRIITEQFTTHRAKSAPPCHSQHIAKSSPRHRQHVAICAGASAQPRRSPGAQPIRSFKASEGPVSSADLTPRPRSPKSKKTKHL